MNKFNHGDNPVNSDDYDVAAEWLEAFSEGEIDTVAARRFKNWLGGSAQRRAIFERMLATWEDPALTEAVTRVDRRLPPIRTDKTFRPAIVGVALAACLLLVIALGGGINRYLPRDYLPRDSLPQDLQQWQFHTDVAGRSDASLSDGSEIEMGAASEVLVEYSDSNRNISLRRGVAYFKVAADKQRPFTVNVGTVEVVALGTEFNIDKTRFGTDVLVYEGSVEVSVQNAATLLLSAGEKIRIRGNRVSPVTNIDPQSAIDWRTGWVELDNESLGYLVEQLNRYSPLPIELQNAALAEKRVAGRFRLRDTERVLGVVSDLHSLSVSLQAGRYLISGNSNR